MALWSFGESPLLSARALFLAEALYHGPSREGAPGPDIPFGARYGIYGVGLASFFGGFAEAFGVCMLMEEQLVPPPLASDLAYEGDSDMMVMPVVRAVALREVAAASDPMGQLFGERINSPELEWLNSVAVLAVPAPAPNFSPGDKIYATQQGLAGTPVSWSGGHGFLTAGHVGAMRTAVADGSGQVGTVVFCSDPTSHGKSVEADVAVVELTKGVRMHTSPAVTGSLRPASSCDVDVYTQTGPTTISLMGDLKWLFMPATNGTYGEVYMSTSGVTVGGDSGGPVFRQGSSELIGHVVGSSGTATSYFQSVDYQIDEIRKNPTFANIRL
jgi:hypothetical protein